MRLSQSGKGCMQDFVGSHADYVRTNKHKTSQACRKHGMSQVMISGHMSNPEKQHGAAGEVSGWLRRRNTARRVRRVGHKG
jgi:hypothetical protein